MARVPRNSKPNIQTEIVDVEVADISSERQCSYPGRSCGLETVVTTNRRKSAEDIVPESMQGRSKPVMCENVMNHYPGEN